jgi:hypothetical protein
MTGFWRDDMRAEGLGWRCESSLTRQWQECSIIREAQIRSLGWWRPVSTGEASGGGSGVLRWDQSEPPP